MLHVADVINFVSFCMHALQPPRLQRQDALKRQPSTYDRYFPFLIKADREASGEANPLFSSPSATIAEANGHVAEGSRRLLIGRTATKRDRLGSASPRRSAGFSSKLSGLVAGGGEAGTARCV
jgi:hypothetical protein